MNTVTRLLAQIGIDAELALEFFVVFSRFEFALKVGGYTRYLERDDCVSPDWNRWYQHHVPHFERLLTEARANPNARGPLFYPNNPFLNLTSDRFAALEAAITYMTTQPPRVQTLHDGVLSWRQNRFNGSLLGNLVLCIRTVRNNLFHGGKYNSANALLDNPNRNQALVRHSLLILDAFLLIDPQLRRYFEPEILQVLDRRVHAISAS